MTSFGRTMMPDGDEDLVMGTPPAAGLLQWAGPRQRKAHFAHSDDICSRCS